MARTESNLSPLHLPPIKLYAASDLRNSTFGTSYLNSPSLSSEPSFYEDGSSQYRPYSAQSLPTRLRNPAPRRQSVQEMYNPTTEAEFEALPIAVRRKYFSTLERLRLAQHSSTHSTNDELLTPEGQTKRTVADRRGMRPPTVNSSRRSSISGSRKLRKLNRPVNSSSSSSKEGSWFLMSPDYPRNNEIPRQEQVHLAGRPRDSVILDAADEAWTKASRRKSRNLTPIDKNLAPPVPTTRVSMESAHSSQKRSSISRAMYESFRWMDEEEDLDLRLTLDDYHANIDGAVLPSPTSMNRPSYRRHMSITKIPFGRTSLSSMNQIASPQAQTSHARQKSKTMSVVGGTRHLVKDSVSSIDPHATHYQDPEARLKLRVYLASPQKFDEAIEFGFPSTDGVTEITGKGNRTHYPRPSKDGRAQQSPLLDTTHSFLNDEAVSLFEDDVSIVDPDSPLTPDEGAFAKHHISHPSHDTKRSNSPHDISHLGLGTTIKKPSYHKPQGSYTQATTGSREMTLRMTLTRPDLRADESTLYGWQQDQEKEKETNANVPRCRSPPQEDPLTLNALPMEKMGPFGGVDGWGPPDKEDSVVKRFWNRVRSTPWSRA